MAKGKVKTAHVESVTARVENTSLDISVKANIFSKVNKMLAARKLNIGSGAESGQKPRSVRNCLLWKCGLC